MAQITLRSEKGSPLTIEEMDSNFTNLNIDVGQRLPTSSYTKEDVLSKIKLVDGEGSGLEADKLRGLIPRSTNEPLSIVSRDALGNFSTNALSLDGSSSGSIKLAATSNAGTNTITFPALTGNVVTTGDTGTVTNTMLAGSIANSKLVNSSITIDGNAVSLGGSVSIASGNITWTGAQTFRDNKWTMTDNTDTSKAFVFEASSIDTDATRTLTVPNADGTIALQSYVQNYVQTAGYNSQGRKTVSSTTPSGGVDGDIWYQV